MNTVQNSVKIACIQLEGAETPDENRAKTIPKIKEAAQNGAKIICLQELFTTKYFPYEEAPQYFNLAETIPGPTTIQFQQLAKELNIVLILPIFEKRAPGIFHNTALVIDADGTMLGTYRKMHIPDDPCFYEKYYFTPGDKGFQNFKTKYGNIGVLICWDQWFPEAARLTAMKGAQILFYPTAIGWFDGDTPELIHEMKTAWETMQRSHGIANGCFIVATNRVGKQGKTNFWGSSFVSDPGGKLLAKAHEQEQIIYADCNLDDIETIRKEWPFFRDRRVDAYENILKKYDDH